MRTGGTPSSHAIPYFMRNLLEGVSAAVAPFES